MTKERPILFSGAMVRAILDGRKTQTRRVVKDPDSFGCLTGDCPHETQSECDDDMRVLCPYGRVGDRLWVREAWQAWTEFNGFAPRDIPVGSGINYLADGNEWDARKRPPMFMPRWASRITLEVTDVRVERVQDISEDDAIEEGVQDWCVEADPRTGEPIQVRLRPSEEFANLWDSINADRGFGWDVNPWVWVVEFKVL